MNISRMENIKITGIATAVPKQKDNILEHYRKKFGETAVRQFIKTTGIKERRISLEEQTSSDLAYAAADRLLQEKKIQRDKIGILVYVTQTPDYRLPATACVLHKRLQLKQDCICFDVNLGCSGYVYGLNIISSMMNISKIKYGLLLVGDTSSKVIGEDDASVAMLFGDAGAATLLEYVEEKDCFSLRTVFRTDGECFKSIIVPAGAFRNLKLSKERTMWADGNQRSDYELYMNGVDVFSFSINEVPQMIREYLECQENDANYDGFVFHQANDYIIEQIIKRCRLDKEKVPISLCSYGNTSVTSIPLTICNAYGTDFTADKTLCRLLCCGFGVGLSWGIADFYIHKRDILPIIETDDFYKEGSVSHN